MKFFSTVNPKYYLEIHDDCVDTNLLQTALAHSSAAERRFFTAAEPLDTFGPKIKRFKESAFGPVHTYIDWLQYALPIVNVLKKQQKDVALPDRGFWEHHQFQNITNDDDKKEVSFTRITNKFDFPRNYVVLDLETTGLNTEGIDSIIQLSAVKYVDDKRVDTINQFIAPSNQVKLDQRVTEITGITDEMLIGKPHFADEVVKLEQFIGDNILIGHNLIFDLKMLVSEYKRLHRAFPQIRYIDTLKLARQYLPYRGRGGYKLEILKLDLPDNQLGELRSHDSLNDVLITGALYQYLRDTYVLH